MDAWFTKRNEAEENFETQTPAGKTFEMKYGESAFSLSTELSWSSVTCFGAIPETFPLLLSDYHLSLKFFLYD
jgi:hypothetical protein